MSQQQWSARACPTFRRELADAYQARADRIRAAWRVYTRRWIVRGHWTHQAYGPGRESRRLQYIEPYIKGPEGAPLVATEKVMVWRR